MSRTVLGSAAAAAAATASVSSKARLTLTPRAKVRLPLVGIARFGEGLGPFASGLAAQLARAWLSVPADLLHLVIELQHVAVGIEEVRRVVDAGVELGGNLDRAHAFGAQERHGRAQLAVVGDLETQRHAGRVRAEPQARAPCDRVERERMVLGIRAQENAALALPRGFFRDDEAEALAVEGDRGGDVLHEKV